jgi:putative DNA primase/helicase
MEAAMHNSDLEYIAECFGKAKRTARGYVCLCPIHDDSSPSLSLAMDGDTLLVHCFVGCPPEEVLTAVRETGYSGFIERNENFFAEQTAESKKEYAQAIWNEARPAKGTLAETYLRSRDITIDVPDCIRYHPRLKH